MGVREGKRDAPEQLNRCLSGSPLVVVQLDEQFRGTLTAKRPVRKVIPCVLNDGDDLVAYAFDIGSENIEGFEQVGPKLRFVRAIENGPLVVLHC